MTTKEPMDGKRTPTHTILQGDSRETLATLPAESVQLVLTSPPYWGLRDYRADGASLAGQWGREATPEEHVARLVEWGREVRRVLRPDGVLVLNYGESYAGGGNGGGGSFAKDGIRTALAGTNKNQAARHGPRGAVNGFKPKDMLDMPGMIAAAFRADGWWYRCWWPWVKMNGMPESSRDRPALSIERMMMFTRSARYYWDQEAVRVGYAPATVADGRVAEDGQRKDRQYPGAQSRGGKSRKQDGHENRTYGGFNDRWDAKEAAGEAQHGRIRKTGDWHRESVALAAETARLWADHAEHWLEHGGMLLDLEGMPLGQLHPTYAYPGNHFATYPPALVRPIIRAATSERGQCPACGAPWVREVEVRDPNGRLGKGWHDHNGDVHRGQRRDVSTSAGRAMIAEGRPTHHTTGWRPSCGCAAGEPVPQVVLDPFCGTGTTNVVAAELKRSSIGIDLYGGEHDFGGHTANDRLRAAAGTGPALDAVKAEREGQMSLLGGGDG